MSLITEHDGQITAETEAFERELAKLLSRAQLAVIARLASNLQLVSGQIADTSFNRSQLRRVDQLLASELHTLGLEDLVTVFVSQYAGQVDWFRRILEDSLGKVDVAKVFAFTQDDHSNLAIFQQHSALQIEELVAEAGRTARNRALLSIGATSPAELAHIIGNALDKTPGEAKVLAGDSISTFYRTVADLGFREIEKEGGEPLRFKPVGPRDILNRPFCARMMKLGAEGQTFTRAEIDVMNNGQAQWGKGNVFTAFGGFGCRHIWGMAVPVSESAHV